MAAEIGPGDVGVLNFALTLEHLEADFYRQVVASGILEPGRTLDLVRAFGRTESAHVRTLQTAIARRHGTPAPAPASDFEPVLNRGPAAILTAAQTLESVGAAAYLGQLGAVSDPDALAVMLSIHSVEARHAAALSEMASPADPAAALPDGPFAKPMGHHAVLDAIQPFLA